MSTRRTARGRHVPPSSADFTLCRRLYRQSLRSSQLSPSTPGAPRFLMTWLHAYCMLLRSTTCSTSRQASDFVHPRVAAPSCVPSHALPGFRPVGSGSARQGEHPTAASASSIGIRIDRPTLSLARVQPFGPHRHILWPRLISERASRASRRRLPLRAHAQTPEGIAHRPSRLCLSDLRRTVACKYRALVNWTTSPRCVASYPLPVRRASALPSGCLQTRSRLRNLPLADHSPCQAGTGLAPPSQ